jgi:hypothetical protein
VALPGTGSYRASRTELHREHTWGVLRRFDPHLARSQLARAVGLATASGRRAHGLRREELAQLSGLSVDCIVRLKQSRALHPSAQVLQSLARALQLSRPERGSHLPQCGASAACRDQRGQLHAARGATTSRTIDRRPGGGFAPDWTLISWNPMWTALHGDPTSSAISERNLLRAVSERVNSVGGRDRLVPSKDRTTLWQP